MGIAYNTRIVRNGLVLHLDAANPKSYPGSGSVMTDLSGNGTTATISNYEVVSTPHTGIHILDDTGRINLSTLTNITTVELWFYQVRNNNGNRYLLDMRTGGSGGWIYNESSGSNWSTGSMYINGEYVGTPSFGTMESYTLANYCQVVVIANTPATDDMNLFSRYSNNEALDVNFYNGKIYNRALTPAEIKQNFEALRGRYGI